MDTLQAFQNWFLAQCNGDWEHHQGITIQSTDNPGWLVEVGLTGTELETRPFTLVARGNYAGLDPQPPWLHCQVKDQKFEGAGDAHQLNEILAIFLTWAQNPQP